MQGHQGQLQNYPVRGQATLRIVGGGPPTPPDATKYVHSLALSGLAWGGSLSPGSSPLARHLTSEGVGEVIV